MMTYMDFYRQAKELHRPPMFWTNLHKWVGLAIFGGVCFSAGNIATTVGYNIPLLWQRSAELHEVRTKEIPGLKKLIPPLVHSKTQRPVTEPVCITPPATDAPPPP